MIKINSNTKIQGNVVFSKSDIYEIQDANAAAYINAVQVADNSTLEDSVKQAIDQFIIGCKADGIWSAIKASCILAGAKTLNGALVPLIGTAPTNFNFVSADYNRKTGLVGNATTKYLNSNRNNNADPQNNKHVSVFVNSLGSNITGRVIIGSGMTLTGGTGLTVPGNCRINSSTGFNPVSNALNFRAASRSNSNSITVRSNSTTYTSSIASQTPHNANLVVFGSLQATGESPIVLADARLSFYSIGESLDLAKLDTRVTNLMTALNAAI